MKNKKYYSRVIYRPLNNKLHKFEQNINNILSKIDRESKMCYIMDDFNIDLLKHDHSKHSNQFLNQMMSSMFLPMIDKPTRITARTTATLIDNIFYNESRHNHLSGILFNDLSDHLPIFLISKHEINDTKKLKKITSHEK